MKARRIVTLAIGALIALAASLSLAQQLPQQQPRPTRPQIPGHPPLPGRPPVGPDGRPMQRPGTRPTLPGRPGLPPGFNPHRPHPQPVEHEEPAHAGEHECPGHGADDPPPPPNLWQGILMVDNERSQKGDFLDRLLFRYNDPKNPCDARNQPPPFLASLINFAVLVLVLQRFAAKPLAEALHKRKQTIMAEVDTATKLRDDAEARLEEYEEKIDHIQGKLAEVRAEYAAQAEREREVLLAEAAERRVRMIRDAELLIEQEGRSARDALLRDAAAAAADAAEVLIATKMGATDHDRLATEYLASVKSAFSAGGAP